VSDQAEQKSHSEGENIIFPDYAEIWKELYFNTENAWAKAFTEYVGTETFMQILNKALEQHLSLETFSRKNIDKYMEASLLPSKKDIARIAELVISVEDKIDTLDSQLVENTRKMADGLLSMVRSLDENKIINRLQMNMDDKLTSIAMKLDDTANEMAALRKEMASLGRKMETSKATGKPAKERVGKTKRTSNNQEEA